MLVFYKAIKNITDLFVRKVGDVTLVNPGSVGQPRDGDTRASCAVFDTGTLQAEIFELNMIWK